MAHYKSNNIPPERHERVAEGIIRRLGEGKPANEAMEEAAIAEFPSYGLSKRPKSKAYQRVRKMMRDRPIIQRMLSEFYESRGFSQEEAADLHIAHIRGTIEREVILADGSHDRVRVAPDFRALESYQKLTIPQVQTVRHTGTVGLDLSSTFRRAPRSVKALESGDESE